MEQHDELVALGGAYSELVAKQQKKDKEEINPDPHQKVSIQAKERHANGAL